MKTKLTYLFSIFVLMSSCSGTNNPEPNEPIGGNQSVIGAVGNTFSAGGVSGVDFQEAKVTELNNGISSIKVRINLSNAAFKEMSKMLPDDHEIIGEELIMNLKVRITDEGIQNVFPDGNLTLVKYAGNVGDSYSAKINGQVIKSEITRKSETDDYPYAFFNIKVQELLLTGINYPGVSKLFFYANHKFGPVGMKMIMEDGSEKKFYIISKN